MEKQHKVGSIFFPNAEYFSKHNLSCFVQVLVTETRLLPPPEYLHKDLKIGIRYHSCQKKKTILFMLRDIYFSFLSASTSIYKAGH